MTYAARAAEASSIVRVLLRSAERADVDGGAAVAQLVAFLALPGNEAIVAPHIHDLWSAQMFAAGRVDARLKPLSELKPQELEIELARAAGAIHALHGLLGAPSAEGPVSCGAVARGVASLLKDTAFLGHAAHEMHTWLGEPGPFEAIDTGARRRLFADVRTVLEALTLTAADFIEQAA
jgi:hypothetical protein